MESTISPVLSSSFPSLFTQSQNSPLGCELGTLVGAYDKSHCCPKLFTDKDGRKNMKYMGSAYPLAIHCIENVGCKDTTLYEQLVEECQAVCNGVTDQHGNDACFANFNSSHRLNASMFITFLLILTTLFWLI